jgi:pimeloyl-ACP methyl ester carboxylesterase
MADATHRPHKSTTGRSVTQPAASAGLRALQAVAPALAGRVAARLFMTPPRHGRAPAGWRAVAAAAPFELRTRRATLRGVRLGRGPAVLLVHGWGGRGDQLAPFAAPLLDAGCSVIAYDAPAHGASGGRTTNMPEVAEAIARVAERFEARAAIAHSLGAAALTLALRRGLALEAAVLVAPPRAPTAWLDAFSAAVGLRPDSRRALQAGIERRVGLRMAELAVPRLAGGLSAPALVVHDRADREVPWEDGAAIAAAWPGARLLTTDGLGHRRVLRDARVVAEATGFVLGRLPRCGCGRLALARAAGEDRCASCLLELYLADVEERAPGAAA